MIDFLKIVVTDVEERKRIWNDPRLVFHEKHEYLSYRDYETVFYKEKKAFNGIVFGRFPTKIEMLIKPHYLHNNHLHNADTFKVVDCIAQLKSFIQLLEITALELYKVVNIEYGINFIQPGYGKEIIRRFQYWKRSQFLNDVELFLSRKAFVAMPNGKANTYKIVKLYAKGQESPKYCHEDTIRFEIKSKKSRFIKTLGIANLGDLLLKTPYELMKSDITKTATEILIIDPAPSFDNLNTKEVSLLSKLLHPYYWEPLLEKQTNSNSFWRTKQRYNELLDKTGCNIHVQFKNSINQKLNEMFGVMSSQMENTKTEKTKNVINSPIYIVGIPYKTKNVINSPTSKIAIINSPVINSPTSKLTPTNPTNTGNLKWQCMSYSRFVQSNNWVMAYLYELGLHTKRNDPLDRKVYTLISKTFKNPFQYHSAIHRITAYLKSMHGVVLEELKLHELATKSRLAKGKQPMKTISY